MISHTTMTHHISLQYPCHLHMHIIVNKGLYLINLVTDNYYTHLSLHIALNEKIYPIFLAK